MTVLKGVVVRCTCFVVGWGGSVAQDDGGLRKFGDGGDEAVGFVEDEFFDEDAVFEERLRRWCGLGSGFGRGLFGGQKRVEELEVVEEFAGAAEIEVVGGDAAEDLRGGGEGGGAVLDEGELEGLGGVEVAEPAGFFGVPGGVVEVAELLIAEGGRTALAAGGVDVAAFEALLRDGGEFGEL